jgi:hypothetical protein
MIVHNLYVVSVAFSPYKTNAPLVINADTVLPFAVSREWMKSLSGNSIPSRPAAKEAAEKLKKPSF